MHPIEIETLIGQNGVICLPDEFQHAFGKHARLVVYLPEQTGLSTKKRRTGSARGILRVVSEDTGHLDDFKDYM